MSEKIERALRKVTRPSRYLGNEWNSIKKEWQEVSLHMVFAFPDLYEVGMSHLGLHILYGLINSMPDFSMERVFAPAPDMEEIMRREDIPLFSLESRRPVADFEVVGFTLQHELSFTNVLNMLDLAGIPLRTEERHEGHPLVIAGGPVVFNVEPVASFFDAVLVGDGEELLPEFLHVVREERRKSRRDLLRRLAQIPGVYVPIFYRARYGPQGEFRGLDRVEPGVPDRIQKRVVKDLDRAYLPTSPIVPFAEVVHDRAMLEVMRGCSRGCRFCQAGIIYRPVRERLPGVLKQASRQLLANTGHEEISLTSLNTADFTGVGELLEYLASTCEPRGISIALPSLRVDSFSVDLARRVSRVRRGTLTFAPEAGTQRLRNVINKCVTESDIFQAAEAAFREGWTSLKLYFMIGLPTEELADLDGIADLVFRLRDLGWKTVSKDKQHRVKITISVSPFVPKAHTPFQWEPQNQPQELKTKIRYLRSKVKGPGITLNYHDINKSLLEAVFSRGDRRLDRVVEAAWSLGCRLDDWSEYFRFDRWVEAFQRCGVDWGYYAWRPISYTENLPWEHIDTGVTKEFLVQEHRRALNGELTYDCRFGRCPRCGVCSRLGASVDLKGAISSCT